MALPPRQRVTPLNWQTPMVDPATGYPTPQFIRLWQQLFGNEEGTAETADTALTDAELALATAEAVEARQIATGFGLSGGGNLSADRTLSLGNPALADPNADRGLFWDDSAGQLDWLTFGSGLTLTGTTLTASGGGGGGSQVLFDGFSTFSGAASGTAFATKGLYYSPLFDVEITDLVTDITLASGGTYRARVYEVSGKSAVATVTAVLDNGVAVVAPAAATLAPVRFPLSAPVTLTAGLLYVLAVSRTDAGDTFTLPIRASATGAGQSLFFPGSFGDRCQIPLATPVVTSVTSGYAASGFITIGAVGQLV